MTLFDPFLMIRRLVVVRESNIVYDAEFKSGVNILAGENSSGKSTILSLLIYTLGADISQWSEHAQRCDFSYAEVLLNGAVAVLRREISSASQQPMDIFIGDMDGALSAGSARWQRYPYRSSADKISFSQQVFGMLGLPELQTEVSGRITIHQILRLHYSDQMSAIARIFRSESFDSPALRDAIGRFLFGAFDNEIYRNQLIMREIKSRIDELNGALRSIYAVLPQGTPMTLDWIFSQHRALSDKTEALNKKIEDLEASCENHDDHISLFPLQKAVNDVSNIQSRIVEVEQAIESLSLELSDSALFIEALSDKIESIEDSSAVAEEIEQVSFTHCPSCFASLESIRMEGACHLCQQPFDHDRLHSRMLRQLASVRRQLKESKQLQREREAEVERLNSVREQLIGTWREASKEVNRLRVSPTSVMRNELRTLYEEVGRIRQEQAGLTERATLIEKLDQMSAEKQDAHAELSRIEEINGRLVTAESERLHAGTIAIASEVLWFLHRDLPRQDTFVEASSVNFSFEKDSITVNGEEYFSASSKVYLKNAFMAGFLFAATELPNFRHLRFLVLDTIEDKGMEPERSQNFQRLLAERSHLSQVDHQIIFATSMIEPSLDNADFVVGRKSTHANRTLDLFGSR